MELMASLDQRSTNSLIGVGLATAGNLFVSIALNLQKLAHQSPSSSAQPSSERSPLLDDHHDHPLSSSSSSSSTERKSQVDLAYLTSPIWWLGLVLMMTGELGNFLSYGFAPASVVAPLGTVALVGNCIFAPLLLDERFRRRDWAGIGLIIIGTITIVLSSPRYSESLSPDQLQQAVGQLSFLVYSSVCLMVMMLLIYLSGTSWAARFIGIDVGVCAISGGFTVLSTKALSSLLNMLLLECFTYTISWIMLVVILVTAIGQIVFLNRALQRFDSKVVVPVQFVLFTVMAVMGSTILYGDMKRLGSAQVGNFLFGCGWIFGGAYVLTTDDGSSTKGDSGAHQSAVASPRHDLESHPSGLVEPSPADDLVLAPSLKPFPPRPCPQPIRFPRTFATPTCFFLITRSSHCFSHPPVSRSR